MDDSPGGHCKLFWAYADRANGHFFLGFIEEAGLEATDYGSVVHIQITACIWIAVNGFLYAGIENRVVGICAQ